MPVVDDPTIPEWYGAEAVPFTFVLDRDLRVANIQRGASVEPLVDRDLLIEAIINAGWPTAGQKMGCIYEIARRLGIWFLPGKIRRSSKIKSKTLR
jgi:hypothetical protein